MLRYHFDILDRDELMRDLEGQEFVDLAAAVAEAERAFEELKAEPPALVISIRVGDDVVAVVLAQ